MAKIRGYRVEVTEVEKVLLSYPMIQQAGVVARDNGAGDKYLAAYIVSRQKPGPTVDLIRQFLRDKVPDYMIPSTFTYMDALPLTNGKLERNGLPPPERRRPRLTAEWVGPGSDTGLRNWRQRLMMALASTTTFDSAPFACRHEDRLLGPQSFHLELPLQYLLQSPQLRNAAVLPRTRERLDKGGGRKIQ